MNFPTHSRFLLYGAVARRPGQYRVSRKLKLKMALDRMRFKLRLVGGINYRNYNLPNAHNRGDHAIIVASEQQLHELAPSHPTLAVNWGNLRSVDAAVGDQLLICGSGYFFPRPDGSLPDRIAEDLREVEARNLGLHFLGVGFNYLLKWRELSLNPAAREVVRRLVQRAATITTRDPISVVRQQRRRP